MAAKPSFRKPQAKKSAKIPVENAVPSDAPDGPKGSTARSFNAITIKALRDAEAGKNLTNYVDEDDLFGKLGIKIGKAKA